MQEKGAEKSVVRTGGAASAAAAAATAATGAAGDKGGSEKDSPKKEKVEQA